MRYKISIIMGIYNCSSTLDEAIDSLLNQTYKNWKLIMCDDGSTDDTYQLAKKYTEKYENMIVIKNQTNMGLNYTLNHCLKYADTEYIARMDADDISLPDRLEKEILFLEKNSGYAIVSTPMIYFDDKGDYRVGVGTGEPLIRNFVKSTPFCHAPSMVRKEAFDAVSGYSVEKKLLRVEDYHLWYKMYLKGYKGYNLKEPLYKMRDDRNATKRRKYKYRLNEAYVKYLIIRDFNLPLSSYVYVFKPLVVGILPTFFYEYLHKKVL